MQAWNDFLKLLEGELGKGAVDKWVRPLKLQKFDAGNIYLEAADSFQSMWLEEHVLPLARTSLLNNNRKVVKVHLSTASGASPQGKEAAPPPRMPRSAAFHLNFDSLTPFCTFEHFVSSEANTLAYRLLCDLCSRDPETGEEVESRVPLGTFNPVFITGATGFGKTHLLMATAAKLEKQDLRVLYVRAETFTEHVVQAIRSGEMQAFRDAYRNTDVLIIDDIQVLSHKSATQEEFFHTFNTLHTEGKQILIGSNCMPQQLLAVEPRLISRFEWGIVLNLEGPDKKSMREGLKRRAAAMDFPIKDAVLDYLTEVFASNQKSLFKALEALVLKAHLAKTSGHGPELPLNMATVKKYLSPLIEEENRALLTPNRIVEAVANQYGIRTEDILGKSQSRECAVPRSVAMYFCRKRLNMPYKRIGEFFQRDHSTAMSSIRKVEKSLSTPGSEVASTLNLVSRQLQQV